MKLVTLRKRREYLRVRGGGRWSCPPFVMEAKPREASLLEANTDQAQPHRSEAHHAAPYSGAGHSDVSQSDVIQSDTGQSDEPGARFGFTVTKRLGNAVKRNRIRRRLKAAIAAHSTIGARANFDYVVIARSPAMDMDFSELTVHVASAFKHVHHPRRPDEGRRRRGGKRRAPSLHRAGASKDT